MDRGKKQNEPKVRELSKPALKTLGGKDFAIALSVGLANIVVLLLCWRTVGVQSDESINIYGALRILDGERIYRDFWVYHTPGVFFLTAAVFAVFGKSILAIRVTLMTAQLSYFNSRKGDISSA